jgi:hypothetical protein
MPIPKVAACVTPLASCSSDGESIGDQGHKPEAQGVRC